MSEYVAAELTGGACIPEFIEIVPLTRDTDGPCTTECDSGDWSAQVKQEHLPEVKQEPQDDVDDQLTGLYYCMTNTIDLPSHMQSAAEPETSRLNKSVRGSKASSRHPGSGYNLRRRAAIDDVKVKVSKRKRCQKKSASKGKEPSLNWESIIQYDKKRQQYVCKLCGKEYHRMEIMRRHIRCHTGERPHRCDICSRLFAQSHHLTIHRRGHSGEKPYSCGTCPRKFADSSSLKRHLRIHTGEQPYSCSLCMRRFTNSYSLTVHMHSHENEWSLTGNVSKSGVLITNEDSLVQCAKIGRAHV